MAGRNRGERGARRPGPGSRFRVTPPDSMMNSRSAWRRARSSTGSVALLGGAPLLFVCATALLLVALSCAPSTAVAQSGERSTGHARARDAAVAGALRGAVLNAARDHDPGLWAHAVRSPALPPDEHDIDTERGTDSRAYGNSQGHLSDAACCPPGDSLRRSVAVRRPFRFVAFEFEAAPAGECPARAPPGGYAPDRRAA